MYFITFTCFQWQPLIEEAQAYDAVYKWFDHLKTKGHKIVGYVIMPNHVHVLAAFSRSDVSINTQLGNAKRFMAYEIVKRLQAKGKLEVLDKLAKAVSDREPW